MPPLKPIAEIIAKSDKPLYAVCPSPEWPHYDLNNFPAPLADWMAQHYPEVAIARLPGFVPDNLVYLGEANEDKAISDLTRSPIFLIGLNEEQAAHFSEAWKTPPLDTPESPSAFYFITCGSPTVLKIQEGDDDIFATSTADLLPNHYADEALDGEIDLSRLKDLGLPPPEDS